LLGQIQHVLNQALDDEHARRGLTRAEMARAIGRDKAFITKKLTGTSNMTLETLSDLAFALDRDIRISLPGSAAAGSNHAAIAPIQAGPFDSNYLATLASGNVSMGRDRAVHVSYTITPARITPAIYMSMANLVDTPNNRAFQMNQCGEVLGAGVTIAHVGLLAQTTTASSAAIDLAHLINETVPATTERSPAPAQPARRIREQAHV